MTQHPSDQEILQFWAWFEAGADQFAYNFESAELTSELDRRVAALGDLAWELGPGQAAPNMLVISPDGDVARLPVTIRIVAMAPDLPDWEFRAARPPRPSTAFSIETTAGTHVNVDASMWRYVLYRFPDSTFDIVIEQVGLFGVTDEDRYVAGVVFLDGLLGEATRLRHIRGIEAVAALETEQRKKASLAVHLSAHLESLVDPDVVD